MKFSQQKRTQIINKIENTKFDLVFNSYGALEVISMFIASMNNYKCAMIIKDDFFSPEKLTITDNTNITDLLAKQYPSFLLYEEEISIFNSNALISNINKILGKNIFIKDVQKYETIINMEKYNSCTLKKNRKINLQALLFAMLKKSIEKGALAINHSLIIEKGNHLFIANNKANIKIESEHFFKNNTPFGEPKYLFKLTRNDFRLKRSICLNADNYTIKLIRRQQHVDVIVQCTDKNTDDIKTKTISIINNSINIEKPIQPADTTEIQAIVDLNNLDDIFHSSYSFLKEIQLNKLEPLALSFKKINTNELSIEHIHELIILCEEKYNEAKQLGVGAMYFRDKFYSYSPDIDLIIEIAYELYSAKLIGDALFFHAEILYLVKNQAVCSVNDYQHRASCTLNNKDKLICEKVIQQALSIA